MINYIIKRFQQVTKITYAKVLYWVALFSHSLFLVSYFNVWKKTIFPRIKDKIGEIEEYR